MQDPRIAALVAARKDSKYLAKFITSYLYRTANKRLTSLDIMMSEQDSWNFELVRMFENTPNMGFHYEDRRLGRAGLHLYYETMLKVQATTPEWTIYFCEDHHINTDNWDSLIRNEITKRQLDPSKIYIIVPGWDNEGIGAMNHVLSRGFIESLGHIAKHGNLDSYINHVIEGLPEDRVIRIGDIFHDFTHDVPNQMDDSRTKVELGPEAAEIPAWDTDEMRALIAADVAKLNQSIKEGR